MLFIVTCLDKPDAAELRVANYDAHKAYQETAKIRNLISGPLPHETEDRMIGSHFLVEAESREEVELFNKNDPFNKHGIWGEISIRSFVKRVDNR